MWKEAIRKNLKFVAISTSGLLTTQQLWDLKTDELDKMAVKLDDEYNSSKGKSFIEKRTTKDEEIKLRFDIVLDVLRTKKAEEDAAAQKAEDKAHNEKIWALINEKQDDVLKGKSVKQLMAELR